MRMLRSIAANDHFPSPLAQVLRRRDPRRFGRRAVARAQERITQPWINDDVRLFAATFTAGFLFVSILIA